MTVEQESKLNEFFVTTYNKILSWEEHALQQSGFKNLSVRELHIIEATNRLEVLHQNTMSQIATKLDITVGALTTAINVLVKKGYLTRSGDVSDRRIVYISLTTLGIDAFDQHEAFHREMIGEVGRILTEQEIETLAVSLERLGEFFNHFTKHGTGKITE